MAGSVSSWYREACAKSESLGGPLEALLGALGEKRIEYREEEGRLQSDDRILMHQEDPSPNGAAPIQPSAKDMQKGRPPCAISQVSSIDHFGGRLSTMKGDEEEDFVMTFESFAPSAFDHDDHDGFPLRSTTKQYQNNQRRSALPQEQQEMSMPPRHQSHGNGNGKRAPLLNKSNKEQRACLSPCPKKKRKLMEALAKSDAPVSASGPRYPWLVDRRDMSGRRPGDQDYDPSTLHIPAQELEKMTPFNRQFWEIKRQRMDLVLFVRHGSFYNLFDLDCDIGMSAGLNLSGKKTVNMWKCGCTKNVFAHWASRVLGLGLSVGRVEELGESVKKGKILQRELVEILTPGTTVCGNRDDVFSSTSSGSSDGASAPLLCIVENGADSFGMCILDALTARISYGQFIDDSTCTLLKSVISTTNPSEFVFEQEGIKQSTYKILKTSKSNLSSQESRKIAMSVQPKDSKRFIHMLCSNEAKTSSERRNLSRQISDQISVYFDQKRPPAQLCDQAEKPLATAALLLCVRYLEDLNLARNMLPACLFSDLPLPGRTFANRSNGMFLDERASRHLEVLEGSMSDMAGSLFHFLDRTASSSGQRLLREWITRPLLKVDEINERFNAMEFLSHCPRLGDRFQDAIAETPDFERLLPRCLQILGCASGLNKVQGRITDPRVGSLATSVIAIDINQGKLSLIMRLIESLSALLDAVNDLFSDLGCFSGQDQPVLLSWLKDVAARASTPMQQLEPLFHPDNFISKSEDFAPTAGISPKYDQANKRVHEISKRMEADPLNNTNDEVELESALLERKSQVISFLHGVCDLVSDSYATWLELCNAMAAVDILIGFGKLTKRSEVAKKVFCRPEFVEDEGDQQEHEPVLELVQGWHPLLSYYLASDAIMQNDIKIGEGHGGQAMLLTGPNMGGKSTLLRLSAVCIIMAQVGCWVPAKAMRLSLFDRIFTRMGAEDRLLEGMSTFFVELQDTSVMLHHATRRSLVILDELGRGTSTWDGTAIAYSVLKYFQRMGCICLFATHLLGVITAENKVKVCHMELEGSKPTFRLKAGLAPYGSCGIALAERAGLPKQLVQRAQQISLD